MLIMPSLTLTACQLRPNWSLFYCRLKHVLLPEVRWENLITFCEIRPSCHMASILSVEGTGYPLKEGHRYTTMVSGL